jgi:flagellar biogenesis protein FliO
MAARVEIMVRFLRLTALIVLAVAIARPLAAQLTPAPPDWEDNRSSVYLGAGEKPLATNDSAAPAAADSVAPTLRTHVVEARPQIEATAQRNASTLRKFDTSVVPSAHVDVPPNESGRHLAPPGARQGGENNASSSGRTNVEPRRLIDFGLPAKSMYTMATGLAIALGSFLLFAWVLRRGGRGRMGRGMLPAEAVSVLGRVSLSAKQVAQLLRVGNKLVLVALTPGGAETLTEVTDPVEVDRLMGLCQQHDPRSTTQAFEQVFQNLSREPAPSGFLGGDMLPSSISPVVAAYRSHRGDSARG